MPHNLQYILGTGLLVIGALVVAVMALALMIKALKDAFAKHPGIAPSGIKLPSLIALLKLIMSSPEGLGVVLGALILWLGLCMADGGTWLFFLSFENPKPA